MNDGNLLIFGCAVSFIALAGAYLYLREGFSRGHRPSENEVVARVELKPRVEVHS